MKQYSGLCHIAFRPAEKQAELQPAPVAAAKTSKYAGLLKIAYDGEMAKVAIFQGWDRFQAAHPLLGTGVYFLPGIGTMASGVDSARSFGRAGSALMRGRLLAALGHTAGGVGNAAIAAVSAIPGGGIIGRGLGAAGRGLLRLVGRGGKLGRGAMRVATPTLQGMRQGYRALGQMAKPYGGWKTSVGAGGLLLGGGMLSGIGGGYSNTKADQAYTNHLTQIATRPGYSGGVRLPPPGYSSRNPSPVPFGTGGFFTPQLPPGRYADLPRMNPYAKLSDLPFSGMPTPRGF